MDDGSPIILVANDERYVPLIQRELSRVDLSIDLLVVEPKEEVKKTLSEIQPRLVICDYGLPNVMVDKILQEVHHHDQNLPFIFVSESVGEEKAVDAMLSGASDFIIKENISRLGPAILREVSNYQNLQEKQKKIEAAKNRHESLIQSLDGIFWEADAQSFEFSYVSPQAKKILGYTPEEWLENPDFWKNHIHPDDRPFAVNFCHRRTQEGKDHSFEYRMVSAENETIWLRDYVKVVMENDEPSYLQGFMVDISERKLAEQQRDKAYAIANIGHWELDLITNSLYWSDAIKDLHEVPTDFEPDLESAIDFYKEGHHKQKIQEVVNHSIETGAPFDVELKIVTAKGNERWIRAVGETEFINGKCQRIFGSTQDITNRKRYEQKIQQTEQRLREIVENSTNMFYRHDTNHVLTYLSPQSKDFLGYEVDEAKSRWTEFATSHPVNKIGFELTQRAIETGEPQPSYELQLEKKGGEIIWVLVNEAPIVEDGETVAIVGALTDITNQKRYEDQLEQLSLIASKTTDMIIMTDAEERITWVNSAFEERTGYNLDEILGYNPGELLQGPDTDPNTVKRIAQKIEKRETVQEVILNYSKSGQEYWLDVTIDPILDADGNCTGFIAIERDVTTEIERSQKMQENIERYQMVSKATSDTIWDLDLRTNTIEYNQNIYSMFGYDKDEVKEVSQWWKSKIHPSDQQHVQNKIDDALSSDLDRIQFEYRFKCADGRYKYIYDRAFVVRSGGTPIRIIGAMQDITSFKQREQRSRKFQEVISSIATNHSLQQMPLLDALGQVLQASAKALNVDRVNMWLLEGHKLRCVCSCDDGELNNMRGTILTKESCPTYFNYINKQRIINAENPKEHEAFAEILDSYIINNNIQSILDTSVLSYGSTQAVVCHETTTQKRDWNNDEISFAGAITDQIAQLLASDEKKERDQKIRDSLKEKETLLAEVHHRVKNNLAVVSGMMQLQAYEEENQGLRNKLFDSVARIQTMAAIHELLYQSNSFSKLRLDENLKKLIASISDTLQSKADIEFKFSMDPILLNVNQAIPCSLIVNEVVTNAFKHAFNEHERGHIRIALDQKEREIKLSVKDNGKGLPEPKQLKPKSSLGFQLIETLTTQLDGHYEFKSDNYGTEFILRFQTSEVKGIGSAHIN